MFMGLREISAEGTTQRWRESNAPTQHLWLVVLHQLRNQLWVCRAVRKLHVSRKHLWRKNNNSQCYREMPIKNQTGRLPAGRCLGSFICTWRWKSDCIWIFLKPKLTFRKVPLRRGHSNNNSLNSILRRDTLFSVLRLCGSEHNSLNVTQADNSGAIVYLMPHNLFVTQSLDLESNTLIA